MSTGWERLGRGARRLGRFQTRALPSFLYVVADRLVLERFYVTRPGG